MSIQSIFDVVHVEFSQMEGTQTLHDIFLNSSSCCNYAINHFMLSQVTDNLSHPAWWHIGCISQEDCASNFWSISRITCLFIISLVQRFIRKSPSYHFINNLNSSMEMGSLKSHCCKTFKEVFIIYSLVKIISFYSSWLKSFTFEEHILNLLLNSFRGNKFWLVVHYQRIINLPTNQFIKLRKNSDIIFQIKFPSSWPKLMNFIIVDRLLNKN